MPQGMNGILADEMGLGKTVQALALLSHVSEQYGAWGPFLVIAPASTLHNWLGEMARFVPAFKVKTLRTAEIRSCIQGKKCFFFSIVLKLSFLETLFNSRHTRATVAER